MGLALASKVGIVVLAGARTPIGSFGGVLKDVPGYELGAVAAREALSRAGVAAEDLDEVVMGCISQVGPDAYNARCDVNSFHATNNPEAYVFELATTLEAGPRRLGGLPEPVVAAVRGAVAGADWACFNSRPRRFCPVDKVHDGLRQHRPYP
jgi:hypothetical protein